MEFQSILITCLIGYLIGSIQPAYFLGKLKGVDIREHGSKNAGAANTSMTLGWGLGFLTALIGKGTASAMGIMIGFEPVWGLIMLLTIFLSTIITNYLVSGTVAIYIVMLYRAVTEYGSMEITIVSILLMALGLYKHRTNFIGIYNGTESTFRGEWNKKK